MKSFSNYLEEQKNTHLEHIEDLIFNEGVDGTRKAINFLRDLRDMLAGHSKSRVKMTVKWDGCVHGDTVVLTNEGDVAIKDLDDRLRQNPTLAVMGKDPEAPLQTDRFVDILGTNSEEGSKSWVEVDLGTEEPLIVTEDHEFHTSNRGWVKAGDLTMDDDITEL